MTLHSVSVDVLPSKCSVCIDRESLDGSRTVLVYGVNADGTEGERKPYEMDTEGHVRIRWLDLW